MEVYNLVKCKVYLGIYTFDDVQKCMEYTGCDGVMSSEALLENPALF